MNYKDYSLDIDDEKIRVINDVDFADEFGIKYDQQYEEFQVDNLNDVRDETQSNVTLIKDKLTKPPAKKIDVTNEVKLSELKNVDKSQGNIKEEKEWDEKFEVEDISYEKQKVKPPPEKPNKVKLSELRNCDKSQRDIKEDKKIDEKLEAEDISYEKQKVNPPPEKEKHPYKYTGQQYEINKKGIVKKEYMIIDCADNEISELETRNSEVRVVCREVFDRDLVREA